MTEAENFMQRSDSEAQTANSAISPIAAARRKPCVLMVGMHLTKTRGGISTLTKEILESTLRDDFDFTYIASQAEDYNRIGKFFLALSAIGKFLRCAVAAPALVYVHLGSNASLYRESVFILLAKILNLKTVAHFHAGDFAEYYAAQNRVGQWLIRRMTNLIDDLIAVSAESARTLGKIISAPRVTVIPNAVDTTLFDFTTAKNPADKTIRLLFVGAVGKLKGERDLIRALQILRERGCQSELKVSFLGYGAESLRSVCESAGIIDWIEFLGAVSLKERLKYFRRADVFVLPTYAEAMPMSVIEAMAANLAIVSTTVGGVPELIENGVDGLLVAPGDAADLADKIELLIGDETARRAMGERAGRKAREHFDFRNYVEKLRERLFECSQKI